MTFKEARDIYWKYYISLENQFIETGRYVEFDININATTYSIEYLKLFQAVCSEIDVVGKELASILDNSFVPTKRTGINEWWYHILVSDISNGIDLLTDKSFLLFGDYELIPWKDYRVIKNTKPKAKKYILDENNNPVAKTPFWWNDYNNVKHNRTVREENGMSYYSKANLKNLLFSFAALYSLEVRLMGNSVNDQRDTLPIELESRLFKEVLPFYTVLLQIE